MKKISILGSTGSIGTQALEVVRDARMGTAGSANPLDGLHGDQRELYKTQALEVVRENIDTIEVVAISGNRNIELLEQQIREFNPKIACVADKSAADALSVAVSDTSTKIVSGKDGLVEVATLAEVDMVLSAVVGFAGLEPTVAAIKSGKNIALANKETLVAGGEIVMNLARENEVDIIPVDSEHSAVFQCLRTNNSQSPVATATLSGKASRAEKILLTASGGPFFGKTRAELANVTVADALKHPSWSMGAKITIDSATLMNKGLEVIEAAVLFDVAIDDVEVIVHRESIIHSMVQFVDGSVIAQMSKPSMKLPIQYAFTYPNREISSLERVDFKQLQKLTFAEPDEETFRCLALAKHAGRVGGALPVVMNAANEVAVERFLRNEIPFLRIAEIIEETMNKYNNVNVCGLDDIIRLDEEVRKNL